MIKEIDIRDLRVGMCLVFTDEWRKWFKNVKKDSRLKIKDRQTLTKLVSYSVKKATIDISRGQDVKANLFEEKKKAMEFLNHAKETVTHAMGCVTEGKPLDMSALDQVTNEINSSLLRNEDAMISVCNEMKSVDTYLYLHGVSVSTLSMIFAKELSMTQEEVHKMSIGAILHDSGKMKVPSNVLYKPGSLTNDEFEQIKVHVEESKKIIKQIPGLSDDSIETLVAFQHHEKHDGTGYPLGLKGDEISVYGQTAAYMDVYDALVSDRCYKRGISIYKALQLIRKDSGTHFNPSLLSFFLNTIGVFPVGSIVLLKSKRVGKILERGPDQQLTKPMVHIFYDDKNDKPLNHEIVSLVDTDDEVECFATISKYETYNKYIPEDIKVFNT